MDSIDVYSQFFEAYMKVGEYERRAALVKLTVTSGEGRVKYEANAAMMPYEDEEDYRVPCDVYYTEAVYEGQGRRSKKREAGLVAKLRVVIDRLLEPDGGRVYWDKPLRDPRFG